MKMRRQLPLQTQETTTNISDDDVVCYYNGNILARKKELPPVL
jgi:hypothetical protein